MKVWKQSVLAVAAAAFGVTGCQAGLGGLVKLPGSGGGGGGAPAAPGGASSSSGGASSSSGGAAAPAEDYSREAQAAKREREEADLAKQRADRDLRQALDWIGENLYVVAPAPGAPKVGPTRPTWCEALPDGAIPEHPQLMGVSTGVKRAVESFWWEESFRAAHLACAAPDAPEVQAQMGYYLQKWANLTGLDAKGLTAFMNLYVDREKFDAARVETCAAVTIDDEASARDRALFRLRQRMFGCVPNQPHPSWFVRTHDFDMAVSWHYDAEATPPSEIARTQLVLECLPVGDEEVGEAAVVPFAVCGADAAALDAKRLERELEGMSDWAKTTARVAHAAARYRAARYAAAAKALAKQDEAWQTLAFDVPAKATKAWKAMRDANAAAIDAARAYEAKYDGPSKKAAQGCWKAAWGHVVRHVQAAKPRTVEAAQAALMDPVGTILVGHAAACAEREGDSLGHATLMRFYGAARPSRGPRAAVAFALADAAAEIAADRTRFGVTPESFKGLFTGSDPVVKGGGGGGLYRIADASQGVIASIEDAGDSVRVTFKAIMIEVNDYECVDTNKLRSVDEHGNLHYEQKCRKIGSHKENTADAPVTVPARWASTLAKGRYARFGGGGLPVEVWKDEGQKTLVAYMGIEL